MPNPIVLFRRGDVARCGNVCGVVWATSRDTLTVLPIARAVTARHRSDVSLDAMADMAEAGVAGIGLVVRVAAARTVPRASQARIGRLRPGLLARVVGALFREAQAQVDEAKWAATARG